MRNEVATVTDIEQFHRGGLLQVTISPHFVRNVGKKLGPKVGEGSSVGPSGPSPELPPDSTIYPQYVAKFGKAVENRPIFMQNESLSKRKLEAADPITEKRGVSKKSRSSFHPNQVSKSSFNRDEVSTARFHPNKQSKASFNCSHVSTASSKSDTSSTSNIESKTAKLQEAYILHQPASNDVGLKEVNGKNESVKDKNLKIVEKQGSLSAISASTPITSTVPKGRVKATRIAADPSTADTSQKGSRL
jgi:hypothetical protein